MADFHADVLAARDEGFTFLVHLTAVDELGKSDEFRVVCRLESPETGERREIVATTPRADAEVPGIHDVFPGAEWLQRQAHDLFGIRFTGCDLSPVHHHGPGHPLRKEHLLPERGSTSWPGALEPGESRSAPGRRKLLPVGVPDPAVAEDPEATDEEVALSASGTRVRRRR